MNTKRIMLIIALLVSISFSCAQLSGSEPPENSGSNANQDNIIESITPEDYELSAREAAAAIQSDSQATEGIWAVLVNLGIGVYTADAEQILPGSESGPDDFWLYDFQIPILTKMAQMPAEPIANYHLFLSQFAPDLSLEQLVNGYNQAYETHADAWLVMFLNELGVEISTEGELTPFVQWLLFVDAFVPPNGAPQSRLPVQPAAILAQRTFSTARQNQDFCDQINAVATSAAWGYASTADDLIDLARSGGSATAGAAAAMFSPENLAHALMMSALVETDFEITSNQVHEIHKDGDFLNVSPTFEITARARFLLDVNKLARCGVLAGVGFDIPEAGPMKGMQVQWDYDRIFGEHGDFSTPDGDAIHNTFLDDNGEQKIVFTANQEAADGDGEFHHEAGNITGTYRIQSADIFNGWAAVQEIFFPRTMTKSVDVGWHESAWILIMTYDVVDEDGTISISWDGMFAVGDEGELDGEGTGILSIYTDQMPCLDPYASGGVRYITMDSESTFDFEISGKMVPRTIGEGNEFHLEIQGGDHNSNTVLGDPECEVGDDNMLSIMFLELAKSPNTFSVGNLIIAVAEPGRETTNNTYIKAPIIVSVEPAGTGGD